MRNHREAIEVLGFEWVGERYGGHFSHPTIDGIMVRFNGVKGTKITSRVGIVELSGTVPPHAVNQLVASLLAELRR